VAVLASPDVFPFSPRRVMTAAALSAENAVSRHTLVVLVDNEPGVLARVIGLFSGRGYNIESLTVAEVDPEKHISRITIVTTGTLLIVEQIKAQLGRLVPVHVVKDLTVTGRAVERELALIKVHATGMQRVECLMLADSYRAHVVDTTADSFIFEVTGSAEKIAAFLRVVEPIGVVELARAGVVAMDRGGGHL
jgi:acetolactate synthase-1/3 small subunit